MSDVYEITNGKQIEQDSVVWLAGLLEEMATGAEARKVQRDSGEASR